jgi:hypothetical protein
MLLQILNDIRVGCWNALGQREQLELKTEKLTAKELRNFGLMNIAGYFEHSLLMTDK